MKQTIITSFFAAGIMLLGASASCQAGEVPEHVDINLQASNPALAAAHKDSKTVPGFSHARHAEVYLQNNSAHASLPYEDHFTCTACHPGLTTREGVDSEDARANQVEAVTRAGGVKEYMHILCIDCHRSMKKETLASGPTSCKECHNAR